jgi:hypothetical protein
MPQQGDTIEFISPTLGCPTESVDRAAFGDFMAASKRDDSDDEQRVVSAALVAGCRAFGPGDGQFLVTETAADGRFARIAVAADVSFWVPLPFIKTSN